MGRTILFTTMLAVALAGCQLPAETDDGAEGEGGHRVCDPGTTQACACPPDREGIQSCKEGGTGWGTCDCGEMVAGMTYDAEANCDECFSFCLVIFW